MIAIILTLILWKLDTPQSSNKFLYHSTSLFGLRQTQVGFSYFQTKFEKKVRNVKTSISVLSETVKICKQYLRINRKMVKCFFKKETMYLKMHFQIVFNDMKYAPGAILSADNLFQKTLYASPYKMYIEKTEKVID